MANGWKIIAIVFIIIFLIETIFIYWAYTNGTKTLNNEYDCAWEVCDGYESYYYDGYDNMCYCFVGDEINKTELMK